jgi:hypothetical protein
VTYTPGDGGPELLISPDGTDGSIYLQLDDGTEFRVPSGSDVSIGPDGISFAPPPGSGSNDGGFGQNPGENQDQPEAPFAEDHPSPPNPEDPLVLDLTGGGIQLTSVNGSSAHFDFTGSGFVAQTGWVTPSEGLLVVANGQGGYKLIGAQSGDGMGDLAALDANRDGVIDARDSSFATLGVWIDANGNGTMDPGEVVSLSSLGITSINLSSTPSTALINGNSVVSTASFTMTGAGGPVTRTMAEVDFATNGLQTHYTPPAGFTFNPAASLLPQLIGYGKVPNLSVAMSLDPTLLASVQNLVLNAGTMSGADFDAAFQAMVQQWVGVSGIDPTSEGPYVDARHLAVVYAFYGLDPTTQPVYRILPNGHSGPLWEGIYSSIISELEVRFASLVPLSQLLNGASWSTVQANPLLPFASIQFDVKTDTISVDYNALVRSIVQDAPSDPTAAATYYGQTLGILRDLRVDLFGEDNRAMATAFAIAAENAGMSRAGEAMFFASIGFGMVDEGATTGALQTGMNDVVLLGTGDKTLSSGLADIVVYASTGGNDTLINGGTNRLVLTDIASTGATLERPNAGNDLLIVDNATGAVVTVAGQFSGAAEVALEDLTFSDGISLDKDGVQTALRAEAVHSIVAAAASGATFAQEQATLNEFGFPSAFDGDGLGTLGGTAGIDVLFLGTGDKTASGGGGADIYVYAAADGNDTVADGSDLSQIVFSDIDASGVSLSRDPASRDLKVTILATGKVVTIVGQFNGLGFGNLQSFSFADGTVWTADDVKQKLLAQEEAVPGGAVYGYAISDDTLVAGPGDQYLSGQGGADTYVYSSAGGNDTIDDGHNQSRLVFTDIDSAGVSLSRNGTSRDLQITILATGKVLTVVGQFNGAGLGNLQSFTFADGTVWTASQVMQMLLAQAEAVPNGSVYGFAGINDTLVAGPGNQYLNGQGGADTYVYASADGNDTIDDGGSQSRLVFSDINASGVSLSRNGTSRDLQITIVATGRVITVVGQFNGAGLGNLQSFTFADGTVWTAAQVMQMVLAQQEAVPNGSVYGFPGVNDTLVAGPGISISTARAARTPTSTRRPTATTRSMTAATSRAWCSATSPRRTSRSRSPARTW